MTEPIVYLKVATDLIKVSVAALKDTPEATEENALLMTIGKDDVLIIECNLLDLIKTPITQYVIVRRENERE